MKCPYINIFRPIRFCLFVFGLTVAVSVNAGNNYYVSAEAGNDTNNGRSPDSAWKSLDKVNAFTFKPGDRLLLESGSVFKGQLAPKGSGMRPLGKIDHIVIDRYGVGARPRIDGEGLVSAAVVLKNVEGWKVANLELTNTGAERAQNRYGILIENNQLAVAHSIHLENLFVHDVNGSYAKHAKAGGGIEFRTAHDRANGVYRRFEDVSVEGCHIKDCSRDGIRIYGGTYVREHWNPATQVVIRNNLLEGVGGDGIVPSGCDGALVEWNTMRDCTRYGEEGGAAAGFWPWSSDNTIFQFNEVSGHKAWVDAQAYDCDYNCYNTVYQYNYSFDNEGGFMLICSPGIKKNKKDGYLVEGSWNRGSVVRYNLSINDGFRTQGYKDYFSPTFSLTGEATQDTLIYRNLILVPPKTDPKMDSRLLEFGNWGGKYPVNTRVEENIFVVEAGQQGTFEFNETKDLLIKNNSFYGSVDEIEESSEIKTQNNRYLNSGNKAIPMRGTKEELKMFYDFLKSKGNPHEERGVTIDWIVEK